MCDTMAIVEADKVLFIKNSDRDANEAQFVEWYPRQDYPLKTKLRCTWITIPQVRQTRAVILCRPFWMWGAEMGANEDGVVIGNEAVFTNQPYAAAGLTGMDLVRLGLERSQNAFEASNVIISLLNSHGQGGGCGYENRRFTYHNSFIIVDKNGGYVLETAGKMWRRETIKGIVAISNGLTLPGFAEKYRSRLKTAVAQSNTRRMRMIMCACVSASKESLFALLRDHGEGQQYPRYRRINGALSAPCVHGGGWAAASQTTGSWVSELSPRGVQHWATGTSAPCTSLFKPVYLDEPLQLGPVSKNSVKGSLWWVHEQFHRLVVRDPATSYAVFEDERDAVEKEWLHNPPSTREAVKKHLKLLRAWKKTPLLNSLHDKRPAYVQRYWKRRRLE
ncbi:MAG: hypothetical protein WCX86_03170 [Candidatus Hydrogenedentales bacterium]|jgi:secernin